MLPDILSDIQDIKGIVGSIEEVYGSDRKEIVTWQFNNLEPPELRVFLLVSKLEKFRHRVDNKTILCFYDVLDINPFPIFRVHKILKSSSIKPAQPSFGTDP